MKKLISIISILILFISAFFINNVLASPDNFSGNEVTFAQISDLHIWSIEENQQKTFPELLLRDAVSRINANKKIDFTLITGDIVDAPDKVLFGKVLKIFNLLNKPWYYVLGNHDCSYPYQYPKEVLMDVEKDLNPNFIPNGRFYAFQPKAGFTFIGMDGGSYYIDNEQLNFIDATIKSNPDDVIILFIHTPIMPPFYCEWHDLWQKDELLKFFKKYKRPIAIFAGHYHGTKIIVDENVLHVATPSLKYSQEYRVVNVQNKKDRVDFNFKFEHAFLPKQVYFDAKGANMDLYNSRFPGSDFDKEGTITLLKPKKNK